MEKEKRKTIFDLIKEYFEAHQNQDIEHGPVVDFVEEQYLKLYNKKPRDTWRAIRMLYEEGWLIQVSKGIYKRIPGYNGKNLRAPFSSEIKEQIFKRDNYRCVVCSNGRHNGYEICADHIKPQAKGGTSTLENGQTLCSEHNLMKKRYGTTDFLAKYCKVMIEKSKQFKDEKVLKMFSEILEVLKKYGFKD
jgi:predicted restriction endonuclease